MDHIGPETERMVDTVVNELLQHDYRQEHLSQGLFLCALDLNQYLQRNPGESVGDFERLFQKTWDDQPKWVRNNIRDTKLPLGITEATVDGRVDIIEFDHPQVDHEFLMDPGQDFFEVLVRQYYDVICGDHRLQSLANKTAAGENLYRDGAILVLSAIGTGSYVPLVVLACVFTLHVIESRIDPICEKYGPAF
jgi:hypothetical protein